MFIEDDRARTYYIVYNPGVLQFFVCSRKKGHNYIQAICEAAIDVPSRIFLLLFGFY